MVSVRDISARREPLGHRRTTELRTITAQLGLTSASLVRLLSVTGAQSDFILTSADGSTTVHVALAVSSVPDGEIAFGNGRVVLDWSRSTIAHGTQRVSLSRMELRLLAVLMECAPEAASREHLVARVWPMDSSRCTGREHALPVWIFQLRRHFEAIGLRDAIRTVRGVGYRLVL